MAKALFLMVTQGSPFDIGQKFRLVHGLRIGRSVGEIKISDAKMSSLHAQVEVHENGLCYLVDIDSSNGLRLNGERVEKALMVHGVIVVMGKTTFEVLEQELVEENPDQIREQEVIEALTSAPMPPIEEGWAPKLQYLVSQMGGENKSPNNQLKIFDPLLELKFLEGIQVDTKFILGYGPRQLGRSGLDFEIQDSGSPDLAFELIPQADGSVLFQTPHPELVLLNDASFASDTLRSGDQIRVGSSLIEVKFLT